MPRKVAVERNLEIVPRSGYDARRCCSDGDRIEIVHFIGGGAPDSDGRPADDPLVVAGGAYRSRLLVGTGKYKDFEETARAIEASGAEIVTVAVRRVNLTDPQPADAGRLRRSATATPTCPTPPAATPPTTRCARCAWRARPAAGTW